MMLTGTTAATSTIGTKISSRNHHHNHYKFSNKMRNGGGCGGYQGMLSDDMTSQQSRSFYNQSMVMDENSPHKNMKDLGCTISNNSFMGIGIGNGNGVTTSY